MKKFVDIQQTFTVRAIMDIAEGETEESIERRIMEHMNNNGAENVIVCGGEITFQVKRNSKPKEEDEDSYECID